MCIGAACVGPRQATSDGMKADPYYRADISPYSLHRFVDAGYTVSQDGKTIGSGYGDVKLLGNGTYAAKEWMGAGYQIHDTSGRSISKTFGAVEPIGDTGYFAVPNEGGFGMTTVYNSQMRAVRTMPGYELNSYLHGVDFQHELQKSGGAFTTDPVGGIKAGIRITDKDFQDQRRRSK